tara:strand:- start:262 stop:456 length:195 start_codon:yes stop_codon:yes gene_type:complete
MSGRDRVLEVVLLLFFVVSDDDDGGVVVVEEVGDLVKLHGEHKLVVFGLIMNSRPSKQSKEVSM